MTAFFPGIRPHDGTFFATDFGGYPVGAVPSDFQAFINPSAATVTVETVPAASSGKAMRIAKAASSNSYVMRWLALPPAITDGEMLTRYRRISAAPVKGESYLSHHHRSSGTAIANIYGYSIDTWRGDTAADVFTQSNRYVNGTRTVLRAWDGGLNANSGEWVWLRSRVVGSNIQMKAWKHGNAEPGFQSDTSTGVPGPGEMVIWMPFTDTVPLNIEIDYIAVSLPNAAGTVPTIPLPF